MFQRAEVLSIDPNTIFFGVAAADPPELPATPPEVPLPSTTDAKAGATSTSGVASASIYARPGPPDRLPPVPACCGICVSMLASVYWPSSALPPKPKPDASDVLALLPLSPGFVLLLPRRGS